MTGYSTMPRIVECATADIRHHLWTLYWLARRATRNVVELGVRSGDSTRALLAACWDNGAKLQSYDIAGDAYHVEQVTEKFGIPWLGRLWTCTEKDSVDAAKRWGAREVEVLFIDTDHSLETTRREIAAWHEKVSICMAFHDTGLNEPGRDGVGPAAREFVKAMDGDWEWEEHNGIAEGDTGLGIMSRIR